MQMASIRVSHTGSPLVQVAAGQLDQGLTVSDVDRAIPAEVSSVPNWLHIIIEVTVLRGHPATWGIVLRRGAYVMLGAAPGRPV